MLFKTPSSCHRPVGQLWPLTYYFCAANRAPPPIDSEHFGYLGASMNLTMQACVTWISFLNIDHPKKKKNCLEWISITLCTLYLVKFLVFSKNLEKQTQIFLAIVFIGWQYVSGTFWNVICKIHQEEETFQDFSLWLSFCFPTPIYGRMHFGFELKKQNLHFVTATQPGDDCALWIKSLILSTEK